MKSNIPVSEIMSTDIPQMEPFETVEDSAARMVEHGTGCVIITEDGNPIGIVTERDIVRKVVSARKAPSKVQLRDIMSSPIVWVPRTTDILDAAKQMAKLHLRKLVVMHDGRFMGVVSAQDILQIAPHYIEVTRELANLSGEGDDFMAASIEQASGYCESCKVYSDMLEYHDGALLCPGCKERVE
ncbi:MAG: CBS domain-containing protein [Candidatus Thermoplasmatota archaeon]|nr:CBS domain-containing protein [Euryarchaeota archaeon]MBU4032307.1 CBS domain-containing protein [Candidatus Thermoplasmatota archaeon]MBU4071110.1 CBS domain-containing protein [Candidatus Thermoplasmatota archaeon]MBU4143646.1 CBS domain-containing protein [Candidatus Thermoplasmatota archaeon]MBU4591306.1 CBS domain-containing protein [Candidatus Thermoplasmatota archaeon]